MSALGHEVNVSERPNGLVLDVNPAFGASGPKGIDFNALEHLVERTFGDKAKISFADYSSYYVDGSQYAAKISQARKQLIDEAARNISQFFPSVRSAKDFLRSDAPTSGPQANDARRAEAVRARYAESIRLLESAEKDLAKVARDYERDIVEAVEVLSKRITRFLPSG